MTPPKEFIRKPVIGCQATNSSAICLTYKIVYLGEVYTVYDITKAALYLAYIMHACMYPAEHPMVTF